MQKKSAICLNVLLKNMFLFFIFLVGCGGVLQGFYSGDLECKGNPTIYLESKGNCLPTPCLNFVNITGAIKSCPKVAIHPPGWVTMRIWASSTSCGGSPDHSISIPPDTCSGYWAGPTIQIDCSTSSLRDCFQNVPTCEECPLSTIDTTGSCIEGNPTISFTIASYEITCPSAEITIASATKPANVGIAAILSASLLPLLVIFL